MSFLFLILGIIIARLFWRQLVAVAGWALLLCLLALLWRASPALGLSGATLGTFYGAGIAGFVVGVLIALKPIINLLVEGDRKRGHERIDQDHDRRRV